jgi:hypothetical protein
MTKALYAIALVSATMIVAMEEDKQLAIQASELKKENEKRAVWHAAQPTIAASLDRLAKNYEQETGKKLADEQRNRAVGLAARRFFQEFLCDGRPLPANDQECQRWSMYYILLTLDERANVSAYVPQDVLEKEKQEEIVRAPGDIEELPEGEIIGFYCPREMTRPWELTQEDV